MTRFLVFENLADVTKTKGQLLSRARLEEAMKRADVPNPYQLAVRMKLGSAQRPLDWLNGVHAPSSGNLMKLCALLGVSPQYLIGKETREEARERIARELELLELGLEAKLIRELAAHQITKDAPKPEPEVKREGRKLQGREPLRLGGLRSNAAALKTGKPPGEDATSRPPTVPPSAQPQPEEHDRRKKGR